MKKIIIICSIFALALTGIVYAIISRPTPIQASYQRDVEIFKVEGTDNTYKILKADPNITFTIDGNVLDTEIQVLDEQGNKVNILIQEDENGYIVKNDGSYEAGKTYSLTLPEDVYFVKDEFYEARIMYFSIIRQETVNVEYQDNVVDLSNVKIVDYSLLAITLKGNNDLKVGDIILVDGQDGNSIAVYKVISSKTENGNTVVEYSNPSLDQVYKTLDIYKDFNANSDNFTFYTDTEGVNNENKFLSLQDDVYLSNTTSQGVTVKTKVDKIKNGLKLSATASKNITDTREITVGVKVELTDFRFHLDCTGFGDFTTYVSYSMKTELDLSTNKEGELFGESESVSDLVKELEKSVDEIFNVKLPSGKLLISIFGPIYFETDIALKFELSGGLEINFGNEEITYYSYGYVFEDFQAVEEISFADKSVTGKSSSFIGVAEFKAGLSLDGALYFTPLSKIGIEVFGYGYAELKGGFITPDDFTDYKNWKGVYSFESGVGIDFELYGKLDVGDDSLKVSTDFEFTKRLLYISNNIKVGEVLLEDMIPVYKGYIGFNELYVKYVDQLNNNEIIRKIDAKSLKISIDNVPLKKIGIGYSIGDFKVGQDYTINLEWNYFQIPMKFEKKIKLIDSKLINFYWSGYEGNEGLEDMSNELMFPSERLAVQKNGFWGYINKNEDFIVEPKYDIAFAFDHNTNRALVGLNGKYGYIDENGLEVTSILYEDARGFNNGYAAVKINGLWGFIDKNGSYLFEPSFKSVGDFVKIGNDAISIAQVQQDDLYGYVNSKGTYIASPQFTYAYSFTSNGLAYYRGSNGLHGIINKYGVIITEPKYSYFWGFENNMSGVGVYVDGKLLYGLVNASGNFVINPIYPYMEKQESGYIVATELDWEQGHRFSILSLAGKILVSNLQGSGLFNKFTFPCSFSESVYLFDNGLSDWGFYNTKGQLIASTDVPLEQEYWPASAIKSIGSLNNGTTWYLDNVNFAYDNSNEQNYSALIGYINKSGVKITDPIYKSISYRDFMPGGMSLDGYALVNLNDQYGVLAMSGSLEVSTSYKTIQILKSR
jgi:hypothetical protein